MGNMKAQWKKARTIIDQSGWGLRPEETEQSNNAVLEKKCPFFGRLDGAWGEHPNPSFSGGLEILPESEPPRVQRDGLNHACLPFRKL